LVALNAMFAVSEVQAKPYVEKALGDNSQVVAAEGPAVVALYRH